MTISLRYVLSIAIPCLFLAGLFLGCEQEDELTPPPEEIEERDPADVQTGMVADEAWARVAPEGGTTATYMVLRNTGPEADTLQAVRSDAAAGVEIHETYEQEDGLTGMREIDELALAGHEEVILEPGGVHLMLLDLTQALETGDSIELELAFTHEGTQTITVPVQELEGEGGTMNGEME